MNKTKAIAEHRWKDLTAGQAAQFAILLTGKLIDRFAECSGDHSPIHMSNAEAQQRGFPRRVAHGMLLGALLSQFIGCRLPGRQGLLLSTNFKFHQPCLEGDLVRVEGRIESLSQATRTLSMSFQFRVGDEVRARATALVNVQS